MYLCFTELSPSKIRCCFTLKDFLKDFDLRRKLFSSVANNVLLMIPLMSSPKYRNQNECLNFHFHVFNFISVPLQSCPNYAWEIKKF